MTTTPTKIDPQTRAIATFLVVPLLPAPGSKVQPCAYFLKNGTPLPSNPILDSQSQGCDTDFVIIEQAMPAPLLSDAQDSRPADYQAKLVAAVARTLDIDLGLPTVFQATHEGKLVIPVADKTRRGLILVFAQIQDGKTTGLLATVDPEIQNGSRG